MSICCLGCRFFSNFHFGVPVLVKRTKKECMICFNNSVSEYKHSFCFVCAPVDSEEYVYHHKYCVKISTRTGKLDSIPENEEVNYDVDDIKYSTKLAHHEKDTEIKTSK